MYVLVQLFAFYAVLWYIFYLSSKREGASDSANEGGKAIFVRHCPPHLQLNSKLTSNQFKTPHIPVSSASDNETLAANVRTTSKVHGAKLSRLPHSIASRTRRLCADFGIWQFSPPNKGTPPQHRPKYYDPYFKDP